MWLVAGFGVASGAFLHSSFILLPSPRSGFALATTAGSPRRDTSRIRPFPARCAVLRPGCLPGETAQLTVRWIPAITPAISSRLIPAGTGQDFSIGVLTPPIAARGPLLKRSDASRHRIEPQREMLILNPCPLRLHTFARPRTRQLGKTSVHHVTRRHAGRAHPVAGAFFYHIGLRAQGW
jgi:hypothetical protein